MPSSATPLCRCRVLYIGSAVPLKSKDGLQGVQEPLKQLYPVDNPNSETRGVDAWLSVWVNGLVLEYADETKELFFPIQSLHYCAAVRYVNVGNYALEGGGEKFLPLDSPFANLPNSQHPPIFASMMRRTQVRQNLWMSSDHGSFGNNPPLATDCTPIVGVYSISDCVGRGFCGELSVS